MLNVHLLNSALSGCCVRSSLIDQQPRASPWPCWLCCIAFLLTKPPPTCHCIIPMLGLLDATGGSHLQLKPTYGGAWHLHCIECWNLSVCPNFGPSLAPYFFSLFCPSALSPWVVPTFISHQNPPLYALSIPTCSFLCPVAHFLSPSAEGGLLPVPFPSGELQSPPFSLFSVFLLDVFSSSQKSVCLPRTLTHLLLRLSIHAFCLILLTHKSKFLSHCLYTPTSSLLDHVLCAFACLSLMSVPSTTFLFTHDPLYRMH